MPEETRELTCIVCPVGCKLMAGMDGDKITIEGNACPRGKKYGLDELCSPVRMLTSTVRVDGGFLPRLPVRSAAPIPKASIGAALSALRGVKMYAPVAAGQLVLKDAAGTGVDIVASRPMEEA